MAGGSLKRMKQKRSTSRLTSPAMASSISVRPVSRFSRLNFRRNFLLSILVISCVVGLLYVTIKRSFGAPASHIYSFEVVKEYPHDPRAFTQGLLYEGNDTLFESTGLYGESSVRKVSLQNGQVEALHEMDRSYFGEGLTLLGERLFQVIWLRKIGFIYDRHDLSKSVMFTHQMKDGWGLATDGKVIFGSDGTSTLYQLDAKTLKIIGRVTVTYKGYEVFYLNELEYIDGEVWANVWQTDCIARISPKDGMVIGWILLHKLRQGLLSSGHREIDVLNGIAWDGDKKRLFVTGKLWPKLYEIKVHPATGSFARSTAELCLPR